MISYVYSLIKQTDWISLISLPMLSTSLKAGMTKEIPFEDLSACLAAGRLIYIIASQEALASTVCLRSMFRNFTFANVVISYLGRRKEFLRPCAAGLRFRKQSLLLEVPQHW